MELSEEERNLLTRSLQRAKVDIWREISKLYRNRTMTDDLGRALDKKVNDLDALIIKINGTKIV